MMLAMLLLLALVTFAVPAKPGLKRTLTLTDGTTVSAVLVGDEHGHFWRGADGKSYQMVAGSDKFQEVNGKEIIEKAKQKRAKANQRRTKRLAPRKVGEVGSITGDKKGIIILVNFKDKSFTATQSDFNKLANQVNYNSGNYKGSMYDYFYAQSDGKFRLTFDVVGPVTVSQNYAYYGENNSNGDDKKPAEMIVEAVKLADSMVNYADYDWDGDGYVDQVYVVYAGKGEADGGSEDTIWPHEWQLSSASFYGGSRQRLDNVYIDTYACGGEQNGSTGATAGIGTMCHEFSHCLGYPDFYDTDYSGGQGMFEWDLMDSGSYNDDGYRPAGYTSYERWVAGWKTPIELVNTQQVNNMPALQNNGSSAYVIYNKGNNNEYFLLENRQKTGWDTDLPGKGLLILHVDYNSSAWSSNTPNDDPSHQRMTWIPADNKYQYTTYQGSKYYTEAGAANDPFPYGSVNAFGKTTTPAATLYNNNSDGTKYLDSSVESITQNSDGTISFLFRGLSNVEAPTFSPNGGTYDYGSSVNVTISCGTSGASIYYTTDGSEPTTSSTQYTGALTFNSYTVLKAIAVKDGESSGVTEATYSFNEPTIVADENLTFSTFVGSSQTLPLEVLTENLTQNVTLTLSDVNNVFSLSTNTISKSQEYATVDVTFSPSTAGTYTGSITLTSEGADPVTVQLSGTAKEPSTSNPNTTTFKRVTSTDNLQSGMRYIIGCGSAGKAAGALSSQIMASEDVSVNDDVITKTNDVAVFVLEGDQTNGWTFKNESTNEYLYATAVKKLAYGSTANTWTLSNGTAGVIMTYSTSSYGTMLCNNSANSERFTTYTSSPSATMIQANLYMEYSSGTTPVTKQDVTMSFTPATATATMGQSFTAPTLSTTPSGLTVSYSSSNTNVATVNSSTGAVTLVAAGSTTITATFAGNDSYNSGTASYTLTVNAAQSATSNDFALVTQASDFVEGDYIIVYNNGAMNTTIDNGRLQTTDVTPSNNVITTDNAAIIWHIAPSGNYYTIYNAGAQKYAASTGAKNKAQLLADGTDDMSLWSVTTGTTFDFTNKKNTANEVNATLRYNSGYGFACYSTQTGGALSLYKRTSSTTSSKQDVTMSFSPSSVEITQGDTFTAPTLTTDPTNLTVSYSSSNQSVATVNTSTGAVTIVGTGTTTITANFAGNDSYNSGSASYTLTVNADTNTPGTQNNPYTVAGAIAYIGTLGSSTSPTDVYVSGIISQVDSYNSTYKSITYWISDDGTTTTQMEVYSGKGLNSADFSSVDDLHVGDEVTVCGKVKLFNNTPEFNYNNYLVAFNRPQKADVTMSFDPSSVELTQGDTFTAPTLTTDPADLSVSYESNNTNVATVDSSTGDVTIVGVGTATITATFAGNDFYNEGSASYTITVNEAVTLPEMPDDVEISSVSSTSITISWEAMPNATSYDLDVATVSGSGSSSTSFTENFTGFTSVGSYSSSVASQTVSGRTWSYENVILAPTGAANGTGSTGYAQMKASSGKLYLPAVDNPSSITVTSRASSGTLKLQQKVSGVWSDIKSWSLSSTATTYTHNFSNAGTGIELRFIAGSNATYIHDITVTCASTNSNPTYTSIDGYPKSVDNVTSYTVTGLTPETQYAVRLRAVNSAGNSDWSETLTATTSSQPTNPTIAYYAPADGKNGSELKSSMYSIINGAYNGTSFKPIEYGSGELNGVWGAFQTTDVISGTNTIRDRYSNITSYTVGTDQGSSNSTEGAGGYNREHSFPKSWFGGSTSKGPGTDLHHIYPTDVKVNGMRSNNPYGETNGEDYKSTNDYSKLGSCTYPGYTGKVFEPADEYKGDFARTYFYMVTCYESSLQTWYNSYSSTTEVDAVLDGTPYPAFTTWTKNMLLEWAKNDPVDDVERARNNAVCDIQHNRNPFIDYPGLQEYIWGFMKDDYTFSYDNYVEPVYKQNVTMSFDPSSSTATVGEEFTEPTLTTDPSGLTVTYSSSNTSVATVDNTGEVTLVAAGSTTITATFAGDDSYNSGSASYTLTVAEPVTPVIVGSDCFELVTDASTLAAGNTIVIAYVNGTTAKGMGTTQNNNNRSAVDVTINTDNTLTPSETTQIITLEKGGDNFLFNVGSGNYLRTETTADANAKATISITDTGTATITFQGSNTRNILRYNSNDNIFSCYASGQNAVRIYRRPTITLANAEDNSTIINSYRGKTVDATLAGRTLYKDSAWNTLCLPFNMTEAQVAAQLAPGKGNLKELDIAGNYDHTTGIDGSTLYLNFMDATSITAGKPYLIRWDKSNENLVAPTFIGVTMGNSATPDSVSSTDQSVTFKGTYGPVPLPKDDKTNLFVGADNTLSWPSTDNYSIKAFRAYFKLSEEVQARQFVLNFGDDEVTTGIFENEELRMRNEELEDGIYDLQGRKMVNGQLKRGLYIVNGKKVVIK